MPTLSEFRITIGLRYDEAEDRRFTYFRFDTVREFRSFRYEVDVSEALDRAEQSIRFDVHGVRAPNLQMSGVGSAAYEVVYPVLEGTFDVNIAGAKQSGSFKLKVTPKTVSVSELPSEEFPEVRTAAEVEVIKA